LSNIFYASPDSVPILSPINNYPTELSHICSIINQIFLMVTDQIKLE